MRVVIQPSRAAGQITAPPSKSISHRLLICAALSEGVSTIRGISDCEDVCATIDCLKSLGITCKRDGADVTVFGKAPKNITVCAPLSCRESGSTLRFFIPIALLLGKETVFLGKASLMSRPMDIYENLCNERGYKFLQSDGSITVSGKLTAGEFELAGNVSSQFVSGLLFALPLLNGDSVIRIKKPIESLSYIKMTIFALESFGVRADFDEDSGVIRIMGGQSYHPTHITVEGDYSGAAFIDAFNYLGGEVKVGNLMENTLQGDSVYKDYFKEISSGCPTLDISDCPDLAPILFALAAAKGGARFIGTARLKIKESDRADAMKSELLKLGVNTTVFDNEVLVGAGISPPQKIISAHNDHRIVMAMSVLLSLVGGEIEGAEAVNKSYPDFFHTLEKLGITVKKYEA